MTGSGVQEEVPVPVVTTGRVYKPDTGTSVNVRIFMKETTAKEV